MRTTLFVAIAGLATPALADDLYALSGNTNPVLYKLDPATGVALETHVVTGQEALFGGLGADPAGHLYSIDGYNDANSDRLFLIDPATGVGTVVGPTRFNWNFRCVALNPATGALMGATDNTLYTMNTATGEATPVTPINGASLDQLTALAIDNAGHAYITDIGDTDLFSLNLQTGQATRIGSVGGSGNWFNDLAFDSAGVLHGARFNGGVYTIDLVTATQTFEFAGNYTGLVFIGGGPAPCYPNCDASTTPPILNVADFSCFLNSFAAGQSYANCDGSTTPPVLNVADFSCFLNAFAAGCT
jgi:hypothetical protein